MNLLLLILLVVINGIYDQYKYLKIDFNVYNENT